MYKSSLDKCEHLNVEDVFLKYLCVMTYMSNVAKDQLIWIGAKALLQKMEHKNSINLINTQKQETIHLYLGSTIVSMNSVLIFSQLNITLEKLQKTVDQILINIEFWFAKLGMNDVQKLNLMLIISLFRSNLYSNFLP